MRTLFRVRLRSVNPRDLVVREDFGGSRCGAPALNQAVWLRLRRVCCRPATHRVLRMTSDDGPFQLVIHTHALS